MINGRGDRLEEGRREGRGDETEQERIVRRRSWGSRRDQRKICGQEHGVAITVGHQTRLYLTIQEVLLYVTSHTARPTIVLDSKTGRVTPLNRPL
jgi:hypothetical protein